MRTTTFGLLLLLFHAGTSQAGWVETPVSAYRLAEPPRAGSSEEYEELRVLHRRERERTPEHCAEARRQASHDFKTLFGRLLRSSEERALRPFLTQVFEYADDVATHYKKHYRRERPFSVDSSLQPCISKPKGATSYPSAHATLGTVGGCILAELLPGRAQALEEQGHWAGELRLWGGVHFPSDIDAGRDLGAQICRTLLTKKDFSRELRRLRDRL